MRLFRLLPFLALAACGKDAASPEQNFPQQVSVQATATAQPTFSPSAVQLATGGTVTWVFGAVAHNVNFGSAQGAPANITGSNANTSVSRTFGTRGTFAYGCSLHPGMTGSVIVGSGGTQDPYDPYPQRRGSVRD